MNRAKKKLFGLLGLSLVAATTVFAASLPGPEASAVTASAVTDTITVRVVGNKPDVNILGIENGTVFIEPQQSFSTEYEDVETVKLSLQFTDADNITHDYLLDDLFPDYYAGGKTYELNLDEEDFGWGEYLLKLDGIGFDGVPDSDLIKFYYYPFHATLDEEDDGRVYVDLNYNDTVGIKRFKFEVYDENGNLVNALSPIWADAPTTRVEIPFSDSDVASGRYTIMVTAYNEEGEMLYKPIPLEYNYEKIPVPNTGGVFKNLNISQKDYLVTGLLIFFIAAAMGLFFVIRGKKATKVKK